MAQVRNRGLISRKDESVTFPPPVGEEVRFIELPQEFLEWQSNSRMALFNAMETRGSGKIKMQPSHLAVMATMGTGPFPINLVTKGLGLVPKKPLIQQFTRIFREAQDVTSEKGSLAARLSAGRSFYRDPINFDPSILGGLEIFEGKTAKNLDSNCHVSLLYTGEAPDFRSFQINGVIIRIRPGDPYYEFLVSARLLFAREPFHISQMHYPYAFLFCPVQFLDKTPFSRR